MIGEALADRLEVVKRLQLWAQPSVNAQELLVHDRRQRQSAKALHARVVDPLRVLVLALELEGEVVGEMAAFVVASEEEEGVGVPDLEGPEIQNALRSRERQRPPSQEDIERNDTDFD